MSERGKRNDHRRRCVLCGSYHYRPLPHTYCTLCAPSERLYGPHKAPGRPSRTAPLICGHHAPHVARGLCWRCYQARRRAAQRLEAR